MHEYEEGDKSKAICETCEEIQTTTMIFRDIELLGGIIRGILVGVCDSCDSLVSIPHQSSPSIEAFFGDDDE